MHTKQTAGKDFGPTDGTVQLFTALLLSEKKILEYVLWRFALVCERLRCEPWRPWGWGETTHSLGQASLLSLSGWDRRGVKAPESGLMLISHTPPLSADETTKVRRRADPEARGSERSIVTFRLPGSR